MAAQLGGVLEPSEFLRIAELAALGMPEDPEERDAFLRARDMLSAFASEVTRDPAARAPAATSCRLRADEPRAGLPEGAVFAIAPEHGERLVQAPRVL